MLQKLFAKATGFSYKRKKRILSCGFHNILLYSLYGFKTTMCKTKLFYYSVSVDQAYNALYIIYFIYKNVFDFGTVR